MSGMQECDAETAARTRRVRELCHELAELFNASLERRRVMDRLLAQLEQVTRRVRAQMGLSTQSGEATPRGFTQPSE